MDPITLGAIASGAGQLLSSVVGNVGSRKAQNKAFRQNIQLWKMQNEYNHPVEQMARLKSAGLNPNLIYGGSPSSATGNADKPAPSQAPEFKFENPLTQIHQFADLKARGAQIDNLQEQNKNIIQDTMLKSMQAMKTNAEGQSAKTKAMMDNALFKTNFDIAQASKRKLEQEIIGNDIDILVKHRTANEKVKNFIYQNDLLKKQMTGQDLTNKLRKLETELKAEGLENAGPIMKWLYRHFESTGDNLQYFYDLWQGKTKPRKLD